MTDKISNKLTSISPPISKSPHHFLSNSKDNNNVNKTNNTIVSKTNNTIVNKTNNTIISKTNKESVVNDRIQIDEGILSMYVSIYLTNTIIIYG
jgi:hypothetical protein